MVTIMKCAFYFKLCQVKITFKNAKLATPIRKKFWYLSAIVYLMFQNKKKCKYFYFLKVLNFFIGYFPKHNNEKSQPRPDGRTVVLVIWEELVRAFWTKFLLKNGGRSFSISMMTFTCQCYRTFCFHNWPSRAFVPNDAFQTILVLHRSGLFLWFIWYRFVSSKLQ
jgi:hypothetical protein